MLWFSVWSVLVVGTLVGAFFLGRHLFRAGKALLEALEELTGHLDLLAERTEELAATVGTSPEPVDMVDAGPARARRDALLDRRADRRVHRAERHEAAYRRWWSYVR